MRLPLWIAPLVISACATARPASAKPGVPVQFGVGLTDPASQYVHIEATFPSRSARTRLAMPAWTPGSYRIRDFAKHVFGFAARTTQGTPLPVRAIDKQTWEVDNDGVPFVVRYRVYAATPSVRTSVLDDTHAALNGASLFVFEPGATERPHVVRFTAPEDWQVFTALPLRDGAYVAESYDQLVDSPFEVGTPTVDRFDVDGTAFEYVLTSPADLSLDRARLVQDAGALTRTFSEMMGGLPMRRYVFFMHVGDQGGGGLEHADSTMMMMRSAEFDTAAGYSNAARLLAHEFFHLWNVKRIRDRNLGPFDYLHENYSRLLWFHEGLTETMEALAMRRSGLWSAQQYLDHLARTLTGYQQRPGRDAMPLSEVSFRAWTHAYQPENNHPNETISYYEKGDLLGVALDLRIRLASDGKGSLPGMFRRLMARYGSKGIGITAQAVVEAASAEAGEDLSDFFVRHVDGVEPLPLVALLEQAGLLVKSRPVWTRPDGADLPDAAQLRAWVGLELQGTQIRNVVSGGPAATAPLLRGDEIIAVQGRKTSSEAAIRVALGRVGPGGRVSVSAFRGSRLVTVDLDVQESPHRVYTLELPASPSPVLESWLHL